MLAVRQWLSDAPRWAGGPWVLLAVLALTPLPSVAEEGEPVDIQAELDHRQELLESFLQSANQDERIRIAEKVLAVEQFLLKQEIPKELRHHLLDEHLGLMAFLAEYYELRDPEREIALWEESVACRIVFHEGLQHWQVRFAQAQLTQAQIRAELDENRKQQLAKARELFQQGKAAQQNGRHETAIRQLKECAEIHEASWEGSA